MKPTPDMQAERQKLFDSWTGEHAAILERTARAFALPGDRDDLLQELLLAVWKAAPAYRGGSSVATFLYRVTHNAALTWSRGRKIRRERDERFASEAEHSATTPATNDSKLEEEAQLRQLYDEIRRLDPVDRSLVLLSLDGLSYDSISTVHGMTVSNVGVRLNRARQTLAAKLNPTGGRR